MSIIHRKWSKHKKLFFLAPERARTVFNAFLECMYFKNYRFHISDMVKDWNLSFFGSFLTTFGDKIIPLAVTLVTVLTVTVTVTF